MKRLICLLALFALACSSAYALSFTDACGRSVSVEAPQRVVSLYNSYGDAWSLSGGTLVGSIADYGNGTALSPDVQNLGSHISPNLELLFSLDPDFVLMSADVAAHRKLAPVLEQAGIPCALFSTPDWRSYMENIRLFTALNGKPGLYEAQYASVQQPIEAMIAEAQAMESSPSALLIRANSTSLKARDSEGTVAGHILCDMGFLNLADGNSLLCEGIGMEAILLADPDYIFAVLQGTDSAAAEATLDNLLRSNPAWSSLTAVREDRFFILDRSLFHYHPNERWAEAYRFILDIRKGATA